MAVELRQLLLAYKTLDDDSIARLLQGLDFICHPGSGHIKFHIRQFPAYKREYFSGKPQHSIRIGRMGEAAYKQQSFPLCKVILYVIQKGVIDIRRNGLCGNASVNGVYGVDFHIGRIIGNSCLVHHGQLHGFPVIRLPLDVDIPGQLIFPSQTQKVQVVSIVNHLHIGVIFYKIHIFGGNMGTVQVRK